MLDMDLESRTLKSLGDLGGFVRDFLRGRPKGAVVGLSGGLGAGKTTFVRTLVHELSAAQGGKPPRVVSPTYVLHQSYPALKPPVDHFDLYRFESATDSALLEIGYFETLENCRRQGGFLFVEWPEKAAPLTLLDLDETLHFSLEADHRVVRLKD